MRQIAEVETLEAVGRSPQSLLTQQLAQMAVEPRPSMSGGEELAQEEAPTYHGRQSSQEGILKVGKVKKTRKY